MSVTERTKISSREKIKRRTLKWRDDQDRKIFYESKEGRILSEGIGGTGAGGGGVRRRVDVGLKVEV